MSGAPARGQPGAAVDPSVLLSASSKAAQKYEYAWMLEPVYALSAGEELKKLNDDVLTPSIRSADYLNWAAKDGWEVCPSGINHKIDNRGWKYYTLMRRPIK